VRRPERRGRAARLISGSPWDFTSAGCSWINLAGCFFPVVTIPASINRAKAKSKQSHRTIRSLRERYQESQPVIAAATGLGIPELRGRLTAGIYDHRRIRITALCMCRRVEGGKLQIPDLGLCASSEPAPRAGLAPADRAVSARPEQPADQARAEPVLVTCWLCTSMWMTCAQPH
jgi:hypothetical protein